MTPSATSTIETIGGQIITSSNDFLYYFLNNYFSYILVLAFLSAFIFIINDKLVDTLDFKKISETYTWKSRRKK